MLSRLSFEGHQAVDHAQCAQRHHAARGGGMPSQGLARQDKHGEHEKQRGHEPIGAKHVVVGNEQLVEVVVKVELDGTHAITRHQGLGNEEQAADDHIGHQQPSGLARHVSGAPRELQMGQVAMYILEQVARYKEEQGHVEPVDPSYEGCVAGKLVEGMAQHHKDNAERL